MTDRKINIMIDPMGVPHVEPVGFQGQGCTEATQSIEEALAKGSGGVSRKLTDDYHEHEGVVEAQEVHW